MGKETSLWLSFRNHPSGVPVSHHFRVHHYKWTDALIRGLHRRLATPGVSPARQEYGTKLLAYFEAHDGFDVSAPYAAGWRYPSPPDRCGWRRCGGGSSRT